MGKETGLIFTGESVKAILDGRKSQTRRTRGLDYINENPDIWEPPYFNPCTQLWEFLHKEDKDVLEIKCPYGQVGDRLWVREGYQITDNTADRVRGIYLADNTAFEKYLTSDEWQKFMKRKKPYAKTPGQFMYKSLARIWLEITNIRVEKVQEITAKDCKDEGIQIAKPPSQMQDTAAAVYRLLFHNLWDSLNAKRGYSWKKNPWVWVIEFKRIAND